jgi:hypothetical protein
VRAAWAIAADVGCVLVFVIIGRASHDDGESLAGVVSTGWPFLAGLAAGWLATRAWRRPTALLPAGIGAWLLCAGAGQVLRVVSGQGTKPAFVAVSVVFLGVFLLGWRVVVSVSGGPGARSASPARHTAGGSRGS